MNNEIVLPLAELKSAVSGLGKVVGKGRSLPVLQSVRIARDSNGQVTMSATDLDSHVTYRLENTQEPHPVTAIVPFKELVTVTRNASETDSIRLEPTSASQVVLRYGVGPAQIQHKVDAVAPEEFPPMPRVEAEPIPLVRTLRESLLQGLECSSHDGSRIILNSVYIDVSNAKANHIVGTDGRHLYSANSFSLPLKESLVIPNAKFLGWSGFSNDGEWKLAVGERHPSADRVDVQFQTDHWTFVTRMPEGTYPNWRQVVPDSKEMRTKVEFGTEAVELIRQVVPRMPGYDNRDQPIGLRVSRADMTLIARKQPSDEWTEVIVPSVKIEGVPIITYLNRQFLLKALEFGLTQLDLQGDDRSPMTFRHLGRQMIVMPVRVEETPTSAREKPQQPASEEPSTTTAERKPTVSNEASKPKSSAEILQKAGEQIETVKDALKEAIRNLAELHDGLKQVYKEQKSTEKEVESVRATLKSLQKLQL